MNKDLTYNQVMNLIYFTLMVNADKIDTKDPTYILEKWNKYIGINPLRINLWDEDSYFSASQETGEYYRKWNVDDENFKSLRNILGYLFSIKYLTNIQDLLKMYGIYINNYNINDYHIETNGIHPILLKFIDRWVDRTNNKEYLKYLKRDQNINDILK